LGLVKNVLAAFRAFMRWCRRRVPDLVIPDFPAVAVPQHPYVKVSPKTRLAVIDAIPEVRRGAFLAACLGMRPGEIRALDVRDYADGELTVARALKTPRATDPAGPTKGLRARSLPVHDELAAWIAQWRDSARPDEPLFPNPTARSRSRRWHANALREEWVRACRAVGCESRCTRAPSTASPLSWSKPVWI
jgi:integrase